LGNYEDGRRRGEEVKVEVEIFVDKEKIGTNEFVQLPKQTFKKIFYQKRFVPIVLQFLLVQYFLITVSFGYEDDANGQG